MLVYIAIVGILLLIYVKKVEKYIEGFEEKKGILVLYGESFRTGNLGSRERDCDECIETQKQSSKSHTDFIQYVKEKYNITMDVLINTYDTKYEAELKSYYNSPQYYSNKELLGWDKICQYALDKIDKTKYEFIVLTRPDIFIKPDFHTLFNPEWTKIYFLSLTAYDPFLRGLSNNEKGLYYPDVNPLIMFIPKQYFYTLPNSSADHQAWGHYMYTYQLTEKDMGFMIEYEFVPNTYEMSNLYYKMIGRPESTIPMDKTQRINQSIIGTKLPTI